MYKNNEYCMLQYILLKNKLEFIHVQTEELHNIVKPMTLSNNIEKLRFLFVDSASVRTEVALDVTQLFPK